MPVAKKSSTGPLQGSATTITALPEHLLAKCLAYLPVKMRGRAALVGKAWLAAHRTPALWKTAQISLDPVDLPKYLNLHAFFRSKGPHAKRLLLYISNQSSALCLPRAAPLLTHFPNLRRLEVHDADNFETALLAAFCPALQDLKLDTQIREEPIKSLLLRGICELAQLTKLTVSIHREFWVGDLEADFLHPLSNLTRLRFLETELPAFGVDGELLSQLSFGSGIQSLQQLTTFCMFGDAVLPKEFGYLLSSVKLNCFIWESIEQSLPGLKNLRSLELHNYRGKENMDISGIEGALRGLTALTVFFPTPEWKKCFASRQLHLPNLLVFVFHSFIAFGEAFLWTSECRLRELDCVLPIAHVANMLPALVCLTFLTRLSIEGILPSWDAQQEVPLPELNELPVNEAGEVPYLKELRVLGLRSVNVVSLPPQIGQASKLHTLDMFHNHNLDFKRECAKTLLDLPALTSLCICGDECWDVIYACQCIDQLFSCPEHVAKVGKEALVARVKDMLVCDVCGGPYKVKEYDSDFY